MNDTFFGLPYPRAPIQDMLGIEQVYPGLPGTFSEQVFMTMSLAIPLAGGSLAGLGSIGFL